MTNTAATALTITDALNASADGIIEAMITCYEVEDFDLFEDYTASIEIDRCWYDQPRDAWFISGLVDMNDTHDCDDDCDEDHTNASPERFDIAVDDIANIEIQS